MQNLFHKCKSFTKIACFLKEEIASKFKDLKDLIEIEAGKHQVVIRMMGKQGFARRRTLVRRTRKPAVLSASGGLTPILRPPARRAYGSERKGPFMDGN